VNLITAYLLRTSSIISSSKTLPPVPKDSPSTIDYPTVLRLAY